MKQLQDKRLLVLGASTLESALVKRAQELGCYVIVTDSHVDRILSPAKDSADEAWDISWADIDSLVEKCRSSSVDGVVAGYSEFRIENQIKLCERLGLPCYISEWQLTVTRDKRKFKELCAEYGIPVLHEVHRKENVKSYPVIVKPVDRAGSIGISIASNREELTIAYNNAMEASVVKEVVIEDYVTDGVKVDFYYSIIDGVIDLMTTCDTIHSPKNGSYRVVQNAWLYPTRTPKNELDEIDTKLRRMIKGIGARNGCIAISGFRIKEGGIRIFECGFRLEGGCQWEYAAATGHVNFQDIFIMHAVTGSAASVTRTSSNGSLKMVTVNVYASSGTVRSIQGLESVAALPGCMFVRQAGYVGEKCFDDKPLLSKMAMFSIVGTEPESLSAVVSQAVSRISVQSDSGDDMIYDRFDPNVVLTWWSADNYVNRGGAKFAELLIDPFVSAA